MDLGFVTPTDLGPENSTMVPICLALINLVTSK